MLWNASHYVRDLNLVAHCHFQNEVSVDQEPESTGAIAFEQPRSEIKKKKYI